MSELSMAGKIAASPSECFEPFEHPLLAFPQRAFAERMDFMLGKPFGEFVQPVEPEEEIPPRHRFRVGREREVAFVQAFGIQLVQVHLRPGGWV